MLNKVVRKLLGIILGAVIAMIKIGLLFIGHEVLLRKREEARTRDLAHHEAQQRMNEFLGIAGHELKTPLTSVKGNIQFMVRKLKKILMAEEEQTDEKRQTLMEARELLERTDQQLSRLTRLVNMLIESSRIQANTIDLLLDLCELDALIREVVQDRRHIPQTRTVLVDVPEEKSVLVMADASRIKHVILHYLSNAHKFSKIDQPIEIHLCEEGRVARVWVRDMGVGIPPHEHERIWERFYRVPGIAVKNGSEVGLGLGLHICRAIIEQHHGQVGLYSAPGKGSTFWFTLPLMNHQVHDM